jgi:hypothetical protein
MDLLFAIARITLNYSFWGRASVSVEIVIEEMDDISY